MRTTKRYSPGVLERFERHGRGRGTGLDYVPWHCVSRGDPASRGRSSLMLWGGQYQHLLSDDELVACQFACCTPEVSEIRTQFPLRLDAGAHELSAYDASWASARFPGTLEIAQRLGIKHPVTRGEGRSAFWVMTTDLLLTLGHDSTTRRLLAVACKPADELTPKRKRELLRIEQAYWAARDVVWLLITPDQYDPSVELTLRRTFAWASGPRLAVAMREVATQCARLEEGRPLTLTLERISRTLDSDLTSAQNAFWQSVWSGELPLDPRRGWRPHIPTRYLSTEDFLALNPIATRRSAWS